MKTYWIKKKQKTTTHIYVTYIRSLYMFYLYQCTLRGTPILSCIRTEILKGMLVITAEQGSHSLNLFRFLYLGLRTEFTFSFRLNIYKKRYRSGYKVECKSELQQLSKLQISRSNFHTYSWETPVLKNILTNDNHNRRQLSHSAEWQRPWMKLAHVTVTNWFWNING